MSSHVVGMAHERQPLFAGNCWGEIVCPKAREKLEQIANLVLHRCFSRELGKT